MAIYKNPFKSRFADSPGLKDSSFLSMYAPEVIKSILESDDLLTEKATWIIGIPGSGKSSILRLFGIEILNEIIKNHKAHLHLYEPLVSSGVIAEEEVSIVGVYLPIDEIFAETANVNLEKIDNRKLFITLFDLRVAKQLSNTLKEIGKTKGVSADDIYIEQIDSSRCPPKIFNERVNLIEFEDMLTSKEQLVSGILTSFPGADISDDLELHNRFSCLDLIDTQQKYHLIKFILMIDDAHELYEDQLNILKLAIEKRNSFPRWITCRKHIYPIDFLIGGSTGLMDGREVNIFDIDQILSKNRKLYKRFIRNLIDKRLKHTFTLSDSTTEKIESLLIEFNLKDSIPNTEQLLNDQINDLNQINKNILYTRPNLTIENSRLEYFTNLDPIDREIYLILANRKFNGRQLSLFQDQQVDIDESATKEKQAAELFLKKRIGFPLYSSLDSILECSNNNVEQFLRIFSPFIDRLIYKVELEKTLEIDITEQNKILVKAAKAYSDISIGKLQHGKYINRFVENIGRFFKLRTYEKNAPHAPGVTQFAISQSDMEYIVNNRQKNDNDDFGLFLNVMRIAISNNVIVPEGSQYQGQKGSGKKYIFSINRLLCIKFELPLQKGDFQLFRLAHLAALCKKDYKPEDIKNRKLDKQVSLWR